MQVVARALIERMVFHCQDYVQITCRPAAGAAFALAGVADARAVFHSRRNFHFQRAVLHRASLAFALGTRGGDDLPRAAALRTRARHAEKSLLEANLASTAAARTRHRLLSSGGAIATAFGAGFMPAHFDFSRLAEYRLFELQCEVHVQIVA